MLVGVIADDFTGASDIANTLAKGLPTQGGLRTAQFLGVPAADAPAGIEAGVVALKSRSIPATDAIDQSLAALRWLLGQGCEQIVFKYCSTFDSTAEGNIGPVAEALAVHLGVRGVVVCPAFPAAGRTVYHGHLFVHDRLLNESGLENHPLNPMTDPDIRRWLRRQAKEPVGFVAWETVRDGPGPTEHALKQAAATGKRLVIVDAVTDDDLVAIGRACAGVKLVTGGSGIALGLPGNFIDAGKVAGTSAIQVSVDGPEAILAGSCSGATRGQVDHHRERHPTLAIDVDAVMRGETTAEDLVSFVRGNEGKAPLIYSSASPDEVARLQGIHGREHVAQTLDALFADTARKLVSGGVRRLVVAGGETSGAVVSALDLGALAIGAEIDPGVPVLVAEGKGPIALALKSGNFGSRDFFDKALERLAGR
ncbi:MAG: four-carbon acid sugar kinase family protein [Mesorhizobium sp.]|uniref:3-oxo-tetronate kinase n=1 Tax=Mesorhizobium sp. TaxID=1871066 RepID=UPI001201EB88|nr:3-oxo-tetronate kinase [Mesorhizobium sp.]TIO10085.1 MAG: four-carbon acid sugar kinase family protein [Mesorhizobium sp.]TIP10121.1 MAG: four-carbon acid sugar kinase family protein [Mesorhizobium sp.]